jgi:Cys-rich repeat protein
VACASNADCGGGEVCDPATAQCVGCASDADCSGGVCDTATHTCVQCQVDADCQDPALPACDQGTCVGCTSDAHCPQGTCDTTRQVCVPATGRGLCETCTDDAQCCGASDLCVIFLDPNGAEVDRGCGTDCSGGGTCPAGYHCVQLSSGRGEQCVPTYRNAVQTCAAHRTLGQACPAFQGEVCGVAGVDDSDCRPLDFNLDGTCTIRCQPSANQCPQGMVCASDFDGRTRCR